MAWINNTKYKEPERFTFRINDFTGGINNTTTETRIKLNEASDMLNVRFEQDGLLKKRGGFTVDKKFSELLTGIAGSILRVFPIEPSSTNEKGYLLLVDGTKMVYITTKGKVKQIPWSRKANDVPIDGCQFGDNFIFVDGGIHINFFKIEELEGSGKAWHYLVTKPWGTPKPSPSYKGEYLEKPYTGAEDRAKYYCYQPSQMELEDGYKGSNECDYFYATMVRVYKDRLILTGNVGREAHNRAPVPNMVYISDTMNFAYFPASLPIQVPPTGDKITCLRPFNDSLIIGRKDDVYSLTGNTNRTTSGGDLFTLKKINTHTGIANNYSADIVFNYLFYVGSDGNCYKLKSTSTSELLLNTQQINTKVDFTLPPFNKDLREVQQSHTAFDPVRGEWHVQVGNDTFIYNYRNFAWVRWRGVECVQFIASLDKFYYIKHDGSFNLVDDNIMYDVHSDNPEIKIPIQMFWASKNIDFDMPSRVKQIRDTFLISEIVGEEPSTIKILYETDYVAVTKEHTINNEIAKWNMAMWDTHRFVSKNIIRSLPIIVGRRCRNFKVFIQNGYNFTSVRYSMPFPSECEEGDLFYLKNIKPYTKIPIGALDIGGIEGTNGTEIFDDRHLRTLNEIPVDENSKYEIVLQTVRPELVVSALMYNEDGEYLGVSYVSDELGYIFETLPNTSKIRLSLYDATLDREPLLLDYISVLELRTYEKEDGNDPMYTDGYYVRTKRDPETRTYFKKVYDKEIFQPVKIYEVNGIYELKGYR